MFKFLKKKTEPEPKARTPEFKITYELGKYCLRRLEEGDDYYKLVQCFDTEAAAKFKYEQIKHLPIYLYGTK